VLHMYLLTAFASLVAVPLLQEEFADSNRQLQPDPRIQNLLQQLLPPVESEEAFQRNLALLRRESPVEVVRQVFLVDFDPRAKELLEFPMIILSKLENVSSHTIAFAFAEYVDTPNKAHRDEIREWLEDEVEGDGRRGPPNFEPYLAGLDSARRAGRPLSAGLIHHMYVVDPREALMVLLRLYQLGPSLGKPLIWSDHVIYEVLWRDEKSFDIDERTLAAANSEIARLSTSEYWWARLYVAEMLRQHPKFFHSEALAAKLKADENELVRRAMTEPRDEAQSK
jgi:hypothetical protein